MSGAGTFDLSKIDLTKIKIDDPRLLTVLRDPNAARAVAQFLPPAMLEEIQRLTAVGPLWLPMPGPQTLALETDADELYYGGAAGGGKTDLLIGAGVTQHRKSIIFRREYPQLADIISRGKDIIGDRASFNARTGWTGLPGRRRLELGFVQYEGDVKKYRGRAHDLKGFDELPEFSEFIYMFLTGWLRTPVPGQRTRIIGAGNPPSSSEGLWVIRRWAPWLDKQYAYKAAPGELRWYARVRDMDIERGDDNRPFYFKGELHYPKSRTFIPAKLSDNPFLNADPQYRATLQAMPEPYRSQLLYGDFEVGIEDHPWQVIPTKWIQAAQQRWQARGKPPTPMSALGADVARGGKNKSVFAPRYDNYLDELIKIPGKETPDGPTFAQYAIKALGGERAPINMDSVGIGSAAYDALTGMKTVTVLGVDFRERSYMRDRSQQLAMKNLRAEAYWTLREALDPKSGYDIALPPDAELLADLTAPRWFLTPQGVQIEEKEDIAKRLHRSPDCGDAVVYAFFNGGFQTPQPVQIPYVGGARALPGSQQRVLPARRWPRR
jgi:hypothetical protein